MCHVMMGNLVMFRKDSVLNILSKLKPGEGHTQSNHVDFVNLIMLLVCVTVQSLDWETFEQYSTWQLFLAHNVPLETIIPILQHLKYKGERQCTVYRQTHTFNISHITHNPSLCSQSIPRLYPACSCSYAEKSKSLFIQIVVTFDFYCQLLNILFCVQAEWGDGEDGSQPTLSPRGPVYHQHPAPLGCKTRRSAGRTHQSTTHQKQQHASETTEVNTNLFSNYEPFISSILKIKTTKIIRSLF